MDRDFFLNAGLHFEPPSQLPSWNLMPEINEQSHVDRFNNFESNFSSIGSSPVSPVSNSVAQKLNWPIIPELRNSTPFDTNLPSLLTDPGFAERAAKLSCFGSRSFNDRTSQFGLNSNNPDSQFRSTVIPLIGHSKLPRVSSSQSLKISGSTMMIQETKISHEIHTLNGLGNENKSSSNEESSVSQQMEIANSRKRKAASFKGKAKEIVSVVVKEEGNDELNFKKVKKTEDDVTDKTEKSKLPEPPKDYIHVRARRGQATDSHSLAERVRREKIGERMKLLQDLVPGCNKVIGKALMLDEIITYVQSLQHQVEFLSMKLATVNPRQEFDMNNHISKDMNQSNGNLCHQLYPMESSTSDFYQQQTRQQPQQQQVLFIGSAPITQSSVDPLNPVLGFTENFSQFAGFEGDDLHSLVKMGFGENRNQTPDMKVEL